MRYLPGKLRDILEIYSKYTRVLGKKSYMPLSISIAVMQSLSKYYRPHFLSENDI